MLIKISGVVCFCEEPGKMVFCVTFPHVKIISYQSVIPHQLSQWTEFSQPSVGVITELAMDRMYLSSSFVKWDKYLFLLWKATWRVTGGKWCVKTGLFICRSDTGILYKWFLAEVKTWARLPTYFWQGENWLHL